MQQKKQSVPAQSAQKPAQEMAQSAVFPLFFKMEGRTVLVVGAGKVATRRIHSLCRTVCEIRVVAKDGFSAALLALASEEKNITLSQVSFSPDLLAGCDLALAATDDRAVNHAIYQECKARGILVNVCDAPEECDFYFPALVENDTFIGGVVSKQGSAHAALKRVAERIREVL
ncbi:MAG: bifunctional precorrin-2 dehydrogenase/sirohydrochlorin ferrochelatase [Faecalibacterium sp.]